MEVVDLPEPAVHGNDDALIGVEFVPVNHNDLLVLAGQLLYIRNRQCYRQRRRRYCAKSWCRRHERQGWRPRLAAALQHDMAEKSIIPAPGLFSLPAEADVLQLSMLRIDPPMQHCF